MNALRQTAVVFLFCVCAMQPDASMAGQVTEIRPLFFGRWAVTNNQSKHNITVAPNGQVTTDMGSPLVQIGGFPPTSGHYTIEGISGNPGDSASIIIDDTVLGSGPASFEILNFVTDPVSPVIQNDQSISFYLGATVRTSGNSSSYQDGNHAGQLDLLINY